MPRLPHRPRPIPPDALLLLVGGSSSQHLSWLSQRVLASEILSRPHMSAVLTDRPTAPDTQDLAGQLMGQVLATRLQQGLRTVIEAADLHPAHLAELQQVAARAGRPTVVLLHQPDPLDPPPYHPDRLADLLKDAAQWPNVWQVQMSTRLDWAACAPYPTASGWVIVGDIHGCLAEFVELLEVCGFQLQRDEFGVVRAVQHPLGWRIALAGDLVNRGPDSLGVLELVRRLEDQGHVWVPGNHDLALGAGLLDQSGSSGNKTEITLRQLLGPRELERVGEWMTNRPPYRVLRHSGGEEEMVLSHAGLERGLIGRADAWLPFRCSHGRAPWESQQYGADDGQHAWPWQTEYDERIQLAHGHWRIRAPFQAIRRGGTWNLDTSAVKGGRLTALCWPTGELRSVPNRSVSPEGTDAVSLTGGSDEE